MSTTPVFSGVEQPDVASLTSSDGVFYRCYVYHHRARGTIEATIFTEQEHGQDVAIRNDVVANPTGGDEVDCPRIVAVGDLFVIHWLDGRSSVDKDLFRSILDTTAIESGWVAQGSTPSGPHGLYDVAVVRGSSPEEFVVTYQSSAVDTSVTTARYDSPFAWVDTVWTTTDALTLGTSVLAIVADDDAGADVVIAYQTSAQELWASRFDSLDGTGIITAEVFADFGAGVDDIEVCAVGMCMTQTSDDIVVVAEVGLATDAGATAIGRYRHLVYKSIRGSSCASLTSSQHIPNLHLVSRPWARGSGVANEDNAYCLASFKSLIDGQEWDQSFGFVLNLGKHEWTAGADVGSLRPYPVAAMNTGALFDGRHTAASPWTNAEGPGTVGKGKRMNHLSHVSGAPTYGAGPDATSVTVAAVFWQRLIQQQDAIAVEISQEPAMSSIRGVRFHHVDPWLSRLDANEPAIPAGENYRGIARYSAGQGIEVAGGLVYPGGVQSTYDGRQLVEVGFLWKPEIAATVVNNGTAGLDAGSYYWTAVFEWADTTGRIHRSAPATPVLRILSVDASSVDVTVRGIALSMKDNDTFYPEAAAISVVLYRTALNPNTALPEQASEAVEIESTSSDLVFRRVFSGPITASGITDTPTSDPFVTRQDMADINTNDVLRLSDLLPWQIDTNTLQWVPAVPIPPPAARVMATWNNRIWIVPSDDPRVIRYSDEILPVGSQTSAPEYFSTNVFRFDSRGHVVAMHAMDNALIIFTRDKIYALTGIGNDGTGTGASLQLQTLVSGTSCIEPRSVVLTPMGLLFQSEKGIYLMSRAHTLDDKLGTPVEDAVRGMGNIRSAVHMPDRNEVHFVGNREPVATVVDPVVLVFNYQYMMWSTNEVLPFGAAVGLPLSALQGSTEWRGRQGQTCHAVLAEGGLSIERGKDDTVYSDDGYTGASSFIPIDITTGWIKLDGISGAQRVREILVQFEKTQASAVSFVMDFEIEGTYDATNTQTVTHASPCPERVRLFPAIQKVTAIRLRVFEPSGAPSTENLRVVSATMIVGIRKGAAKPPDANTAT